MIYYKSKIGEVRTKESWLDWGYRASFRLKKSPDAWHKITKILGLEAVWVKNPNNIDSTTLQPVWQEIQDTKEASSYEQYPEHSACMKRVGWETK